MMINELIAGFNSSIDNSEVEYHCSILNALEESVKNNTDSILIDKPVLLSKVLVKITKDDWPLAISKCERFFVNDCVMLRRVDDVKNTVMEYYGT